MLPFVAPCGVSGRPVPALPLRRLRGWRRRGCFVRGRRKSVLLAGLRIVSRAVGVVGDGVGEFIRSQCFLRGGRRSLRRSQPPPRPLLCRNVMGMMSLRRAELLG